MKKLICGFIILSLIFFASCAEETPRGDDSSTQPDISESSSYASQTDDTIESIEEQSTTDATENESDKSVSQETTEQKKRHAVIGSDAYLFDELEWEYLPFDEYYKIKGEEVRKEGRLIMRNFLYLGIDNDFLSYRRMSLTNPFDGGWHPYENYDLMSEKIMESLQYTITLTDAYEHYLYFSYDNLYGRLIMQGKDDKKIEYTNEKIKFCKLFFYGEDIYVWTLSWDKSWETDDWTIDVGFYDRYKDGKVDYVLYKVNINNDKIELEKKAICHQMFDSVYIYNGIVYYLDDTGNLYRVNEKNESEFLFNSYSRSDIERLLIYDDIAYIGTMNYIITYNMNSGEALAWYQIDE